MNEDREIKRDPAGTPRARDTDRRLPVTAEVGGEGGSYAEPTIQVATFDEDIDRTEGRGGYSSAATYANRGAEVAGGGMSSAPEPAHGMIRYPSEDPSVPVAGATLEHRETSTRR